MRVKWEVDDGYAGKSRPQYTEIDDEDIIDCDDVEEAMGVIEDAIRDDYDNIITWAMTHYDAVKAEVTETIAAKGK